eukprot:COSAG02_NODE_59212_length_275_cov_0.573864_1_plen_67_part_10
MSFDRGQGQAAILSSEAIDAMHVDTTGGMEDKETGAGYGIGWVRVEGLCLKQIEEESSSTFLVLSLR